MAVIAGDYFTSGFGESIRQVPVLDDTIINDSAEGAQDGEEIDAVSMRALQREVVDLATFMIGFDYRDSADAEVLATPAFVKEGSGVTFTVEGSGNTAGVVIAAGSGAGPAFVSAVADGGEAFTFTATADYKSGTLSTWYDDGGGTPNEMAAIRVYDDTTNEWANLELSTDVAGTSTVTIGLGRGFSTAAALTPGLRTIDRATPFGILIQPGAETGAAKGASVTIQGGESGTGASDGGDTYIIGGPNKAASSGNSGRLFLQTAAQVAGSGNSAGAILGQTGAGEGAGDSGAWTITTGLPGTTGDSGAMSWATANAVGGASGGFAFTSGTASTTRGSFTTDVDTVAMTAATEIDFTSSLVKFNGTSPIVEIGGVTGTTKVRWWAGSALIGQVNTATTNTLTMSASAGTGAGVGKTIAVIAGAGGATGVGGSISHTTGAGGATSGNSGAYSVVTGAVTTPGTDVRGAFSVAAGAMAWTADTTVSTAAFNFNAKADLTGTIFSITDDTDGSSLNRFTLDGNEQTALTLRGLGQKILFNTTSVNKWTFNSSTGGAFNITTASNTGDFTIVGAKNTAGTGYGISLTAGDGQNTAGTGGNVTITGGIGGNTSGTAGAVNLVGGVATDGVGGAITLTPSDGATANNAGGALTTVTGAGAGSGAGGAWTHTGGQGGATGTGGGITNTTGAGGATSGDGGLYSVVGGAGGATGAGGGISHTAGAGGATSGNGGTIVGTGGAATNGDGVGGLVLWIGGAGEGAGAGGAVGLTGGAGGATSIGGAIVITAGSGGSSSGTGGAWTGTGGAGTAAAATGGLASLVGGAGGTSGTGGASNVTGGGGGATGGVSGAVNLSSPNPGGSGVRGDLTASFSSMTFTLAQSGVGTFSVLDPNGDAAFAIAAGTGNSAFADGTTVATPHATFTLMVESASNDVLVLQGGSTTGTELRFDNTATGSSAANAAILEFNGLNASDNPTLWGSIRVQTLDATNATEDSRYRFWTIEAGTANEAFRILSTGQLEADLGGGAGNVTVFDDHDDVELIRSVWRPGAQLAGLERMEELGIMSRKTPEEGGSGWMYNLQAMTGLQNGAIWQTAERVCDLESENAILRARLDVLEARP